MNVGSLLLACLRPPVTVQPREGTLDGLVTKDKFCMTRHARLSLHRSRRRVEAAHSRNDRPLDLSAGQAPDIRAATGEFVQVCTAERIGASRREHLPRRWLQRYDSRSSGLGRPESQGASTESTEAGARRVMLSERGGTSVNGGLGYGATQ
jgi:hypothetical protein